MAIRIFIIAPVPPPFRLPVNQPQAAMTANNKTRAGANCNRCTPALVLNNLGQKLYLFVWVPVRVSRVLHQSCDVCKFIVSAMYWNVTQEIFTPSSKSFCPVLGPPAALLVSRLNRLVHDIRSRYRIVALDLPNAVDADAPGYTNIAAMLGTIDKFAVYGWHPAPPRA